VPLFRTFILRRLLGERLRSAATVAGIALGIAVVLAVRLANDSSLRGFETALETMAGRTSIEIVGSGLGVAETRLAELGWLAEHGHVSPVVEGDALWTPEPGAPEGRRDGSRGGEMLRVLGVDVLRDRPFRDYDVLELDAPGREPTAQEFLGLLLDPRAVVVTERFARRQGLARGDGITLTIGDRAGRFVVAGLLRDVGPARVLDGHFALMDIAAAQWAFGRLGFVDRVDVRLRDPGRLDEIEAAIARRLPEGLTAQRPERRGRQVEQMLAAFHLNLTALSYIALLVGLFLVYNTVSTSVVARREEIGTLRALGVTRAGVMGLFLAEAAALAAPGALLGVALGRVLAQGAVALTSTTVSTLYIAAAAAPPALSWGDAVLAFAVGVPLSMAAAALPAYEASRVAPIDAIRGADRLDTRFRLRPRALVVPALLLAAGGWLATRPPVGGLPLAGYASAVALVFGAATLVPAVLFVVARAGRGVVTRLPGLAGWLAHANLSAAIPRLSVSVAALAVSLSMMVAIAVMIGSFRETVVYWVGQTLRADLFVGPATRGEGARLATVSEEVERAVAAHPAVVAVDRFRQVSIPYGDTRVGLGAGDFAVLLEHGALLFKAPADGRAAVRGAIGRDEVIVSEAFSIRHGRGVGDTVALAAPAGDRVFRIVAVYYDYASDRGVVTMDRGTFLAHFGDERPTGLTVYLRAAADAERVRGEILSSLDPAYRIYIYTNRALRQEVLRIFDSTFAITYALEAIAVFVAILGVAGTLLTLILERRHELTTLRLIGADRRRVRCMVVIEALMMGGVSQAIGLAVGVLLSLVLIYVINLQSFGWTIQFHLPLGFLAQMTAVILTATALAGLYPAQRAIRLPMG
jgi:putative ABC transport system permease protein